MNSWSGEGEGHGSLCEARKKRRLKIVLGRTCKKLGVLRQEVGYVLAAGLSWVGRADGSLRSQDRSRTMQCCRVKDFASKEGRAFCQSVLFYSGMGCHGRR